MFCGTWRYLISLFWNKRHFSACSLSQSNKCKSLHAKNLLLIWFWTSASLLFLNFSVSAESAQLLTAQKPLVGCYGSKQTNTLGIDQSDCATILESRQTWPCMVSMTQPCPPECEWPNGFPPHHMNMCCREAGRALPPPPSHYPLHHVGAQCGHVYCACTIPMPLGIV